ncbi:MAG: hypothetical protein KAR14_09285, partial [Candidatus Aminicenantes bacterium]|nr:hypothetical protein [Candidatus Aminicenantes bacterium]
MEDRFVVIKTTTHRIVIVLILLFISFEFLPAKTEKSPFYINGVLYQDWMGFKATDTDFYNRLSTRLKLSLLNRPGNGWTLSFDIRNRATLGEGGTNQFIIYNSYLSYNSRNSKFYFSLGQMNLYDTAGIGELAGALAGYKINDSFSVGGYAGLNPDIYNTKWDFKYTKFGVFTRYRGSRARQFSLSYNLLRYDGNTEREYLYTNTLIPVSGKFILYGSIEYDLKPGIKSEDRITHLFSNGRVNIGKTASISMNYSSGRGIDYHKFILEFSQDPSLRIEALERYYY